MIYSDLAVPHAARRGRIGLALACAGWGAIVAQRFSAGGHALIFGAALAGLGALLVVLPRIRDRRRRRRAVIAHARLASGSRAADRFEMRLFRELAPEVASEAVQTKN